MLSRLDGYGSGLPLLYPQQVIYSAREGKTGPLLGPSVRAPARIFINFKATNLTKGHREGGIVHPDETA